MEYLNGTPVMSLGVNKRKYKDLYFEQEGKLIWENVKFRNDEAARNIAEYTILTQKKLAANNTT